LLSRVRRHPFPDVLAPIQPSDSRACFGLGSGCPLPSAYPEAEASSSRSCPRAASAGRACLRIHAARRGVVTGSPWLRSLLVDRRGPPRCLDRPLHPCRGL